MNRFTIEYISQMATDVGSAPGMAQLQSVQKVMALPTIEAAVGHVGALYTRVKGELLCYIISLDIIRHSIPHFSPSFRDVAC